MAAMTSSPASSRLAVANGSAASASDFTTNTPGSAMSRVLAIAELREAILVAYCLVQDQEHRQQSDSTHQPGPAVQLFPLQRINRIFDATIRSSPQLRSLMCLDRGSGFASPVFWFLRNLGMCFARDRGLYWAGGHRRSNCGQECSYREIYNVGTNIGDVWERWVLPTSWESQHASWRRIRVFPDDYEAPSIELTYLINPYNPPDPDEDDDYGSPWVQNLRPEDSPTLGTVYDFVEKIIHANEPEIREVRRLRAEKKARFEAECKRLRVEFYTEEIDATYPRGCTPPEVRQEYKDRYWAARREEGRGFHAWQDAFHNGNRQQEDALAEEKLREYLLRGDF